MPQEVIDRPNPGPLPSELPDDVSQLAIRLEGVKLDEKEFQAVQKFRRLATYIAGAMIFLMDNTCLERDLTFDDIKPRLLGHWGTCPGLTLIYAHLTLLIKKRNLDMMFITGPGHGAPGVLGALWVEGALGKFYPQYSRDKKGLSHLIRTFSTTNGLPSHVNAETPGAIHEGGELGYALSAAFGTVMDKPNLITAVVVGDGECETGPCATAWHGAKYIDPAESGAVLPIVHVNGFKISERTIYGCLDNKELITLFSGYGYKPVVVDNLDNLDADFYSAIDWAVETIHKIQNAARSGNPIVKPRWPVILLRTPKGMSGPKESHGKIIEGSFHSHQVPLPQAKKDPEELSLLQKWLGSYKPSELLTPEGYPIDEILSIIPREELKMGQNPLTYGNHERLTVPDWKKLGVEINTMQSSMQAIGNYIGETMAANPHSLRLFSPDELVSNKLDTVFKHTGRNFQWDQYARKQGGRILEILSEHTCQGFLQGYTQTGRTGIFPSYESFLGIISTMLIQFSKFNKMGREVPWRSDIPSVNYIETSTWARQEHNGFSHQNPSFISIVLNLKPDAARVYLPPDANTFLSTMSHCLRSSNYINLMVGSKQPTQVFLNVDEAESHCRAGGSVWKFASTDDGLDPDVVLVGIGTEVTFEVIHAAHYLRKKVPELRVRVVNVTDLMILGAELTHPHALTDEAFDALFTADKPVHINYHGYVMEIKGLLFGRPRLDRITVASYKEEGSTTTPFDMMICNEVSRFHVAKRAISGGAWRNERVRLRMQEHLSALDHEIRLAKDYIKRWFQDPAGLYDVPDFTGLH